MFAPQTAEIWCRSLVGAANWTELLLPVCRSKIATLSPRADATMMLDPDSETDGAASLPVSVGFLTADVELVVEVAEPSDSKTGVVAVF